MFWPITLRVSHHQGWKTCVKKWNGKLICRGIWNSLMALPDWTWPAAIFYDRSTPLHIRVHFGDKSFQSLTCIGTDKLTQNNKETTKTRNSVVAYKPRNAFVQRRGWPHICYYSDFGRSASKGVGITRGTPKLVSSVVPPGCDGWPYKHMLLPRYRTDFPWPRKMWARLGHPVGMGWAWLT